MAAFNFHLKNPKSKKDTLIYLYISWEGNRIKYSTKESINPKFWVDKRAKETKEFPEYPELNERLDETLRIAKKTFRLFLTDKGYSPSKEELRKELDKNLRDKSQVIDLYSFIDILIEEKKQILKKEKKRIDRNSIVTTYNQTKGVLKDFEKKKSYRVDFDTISMDFYYKFIEYCEDVKGYSLNNIGKHIKTLKSFMNRSLERQLHKNLEFKLRDFKVLKEEIDDVYLNNDELDLLYKLDLSSTPKLDESRDLFLISCYTGLRYSDFSVLSKENIKDNRIHFKTEKTEHKVVIPIHNKVREILEKYEYKPPFKENSIMNKDIKDFCKLLDELKVEETKTRTEKGITQTKSFEKWELCTCHTARRSFATNYYKMGVPAKDLMNITGHKTESAFFTYIKVTPDDSAQTLEMFMNREQMKVS